MNKLPTDLIKNSQYYDWFAALLLCESCHLDKKRIGDLTKPSEEYIRLGQKPTLLFPAQAIHGLNIKSNPPWLMQYFFGVFGSNGALPLHLTEYAIEQEKYHKDVVFSHFINIFHHRALSLFYRGWRLAQPTADFFPLESLSFAKKIESLVGVADASNENKSIWITYKKLYFYTSIKKKPSAIFKSSEHISLIQQQQRSFEERLNIIYKSYVFYLAKSSRSLESLQLLLAAFINVPIKIMPNTIDYLNKQSGYYSILGENESNLGENLQLGAKVLSAQSNIVVIVGPINMNSYKDFLLKNNQKMFIDFIRKVIGFSFNITLEFMVKKKLPITFKEKIILGHNCWLGHKAEASKGAILKF